MVVLAETLGMEPSTISIKSFINSNNLYQAAKSTKSVVDRRLRLDIAQIQECVKESKVKIVWVKTNNMLADCTTRRGGKTDGLMDVITTGVLPSIKEANQAEVHPTTDIAKDINKDIPKDISEDIAKDIVKDIAKDINKDY